MNSETGAASTGPTYIYTRSSAYRVKLLALFCIFYLLFIMDLPSVRMSVYLLLVPALGTLFLLSGCRVQLQNDDFALSHYISICHIWLVFLRSLFFSDEKEKGDRPGRQEQGRAGRRRRGNYNQNVIYQERIYFQ